MLKTKTTYSVIAIVAITTIGSVFYSYEYYPRQSQHEFDKGFFNDVGDNTVGSATWFSMVELFQKKYVITGGGIIDRVDGARTEIVASNQYGDSITLALEENRAGTYAEIICNHKTLGKTERITENIMDYLQNKNCFIPILEETADQNTVVSRGDLFLQQPLRIEGLTQTYNIGQKIEFTVKFNGTGYDCGYPDLKIEDSEHQKIWQSGNTVHSCDPEMKEEHIEKEWQIENTPLGIPIINKTGFYTLFAEFDNDITQCDFLVK